MTPDLPIFPNIVHFCTAETKQLLTKLCTLSFYHLICILTFYFLNLYLLEPYGDNRSEQLLTALRTVDNSHRWVCTSKKWLTGKHPLTNL